MTLPTMSTEAYAAMIASWTPRQRHNHMLQHMQIRRSPAWNVHSPQKQAEIDAKAAMLQALIDADAAP